MTCTRGGNCRRCNSVKVTSPTPTHTSSSTPTSCSHTRVTITDTFQMREKRNYETYDCSYMSSPTWTHDCGAKIQKCNSLHIVKLSTRKCFRHSYQHTALQHRHGRLSHWLCKVYWNMTKLLALPRPCPYQVIRKPWQLSTDTVDDCRLMLKWLQHRADVKVVTW